MMTDPSNGLGNGETPPRHPDPGARRAPLDALRATSTPGGRSAARPRRRPHAALASRVLAAGLAASSSVGLIGVLAKADQVSAQSDSEQVNAGYGTFAAVGAISSTSLAAYLTPPPIVTTTTTAAPATTVAPVGTAPAPGAPAPATPQRAPQSPSAPQPQASAPAPTAPPVTAPPVTAPPPPPVTAPPVTTPPASTTGAS